MNRLLTVSRYTMWVVEGATVPRSRVRVGHPMRIGLKGASIRPCGIELVRHYTYPMVMKIECGDHIVAMDFLGEDKHIWLKVVAGNVLSGNGDDDEVEVIFEHVLEPDDITIT
jgi:hypothetical protein